MTKVFKYLEGLSPDLMNKAFRLKANYHNLRNINQFETYIPKTKLSFTSSHVSWKSMSLTQFKSKISK